jgi:hypothetical protein
MPINAVRRVYFAQARQFISLFGFERRRDGDKMPARHKRPIPISR